jgi:hypothetical protein
MRIPDTAVLVTGANRGLGRALVIGLEEYCGIEEQTVENRG